MRVLRINLILFFFANVLASSAFAGPLCETVFSDWRQTLSQLEKLPAVALDTPSLAKGMQRFWKQMRELNSGFAQLDKVREKLSHGEMTAEQVKIELAKLAESSAREAREILNATPEAKRIEKTRMQLEAYRMLLKSISSFNEYAQKQSAHRTQFDPKAKPEKSETPEASTKADKPSADAKIEKPGDAEKPSDEGKPEKPSEESKLQKPGAEGASEKPSADAKIEKPGDAEKPSDEGKPEKPSEESKLQKPGAEGASEKPSADGKTENPEAEAKLGTDGEPEKPGADGKPGVGGKSGKETSSKEAPDEATSDEEGTDPSPADTRSSEKKAGSHAGERGESESLMKSLLAPPVKTKKLIERYLDTKLKQEKEKTDNEAVSEKKKSERWKKRKSLRIDEVQRALLKSHYIYSLRRYASADQILTSLKDFYLLAASMVTIGNDTARKYKTESLKLRTDLEALGEPYKNFESLGISVSVDGRTNPAALMGSLRFLEKVLSALKRETILTSEEDALLRTLQNSIDKLVDSHGLSDEQIVAQMKRQLSGPLARRFFDRQFGRTDKIDFVAAAKAVRNGEMNPLLSLTALKRFTQLRSFLRPIPAYRWVQEGYKLPIDDVEPSIENMTEFSDPRSIFRDGPPQQDLRRLASGELMEKVYRESVPVRGATNPKEKEVYIVLYDNSKSMQDDRRFEFQALAMASVLDTAQIRVVQGHKVSYYAVPFEVSPGKVRKISNSNDAYDFFEGLINDPPKGTGGTNITLAVIKALNMIKEAQEEGGELARAHVLILTDGVDHNFNFAKVKKAKDEIQKSTAISFHAISMSVGNQHLKELVHTGLLESQKGRSSYQFFNNEQIQEILTSLQPSTVLEAAREVSVSSSGRLTNYDVSMLLQSLSRLGEKSLLQQERPDFELTEFNRGLRSLKIPTTLEFGYDGLTRYLDSLFELNVASELLPMARSRERLLFARSYIQLLSKSIGLHESEFVENLDLETRKKLLRWIEGT